MIDSTGLDAALTHADILLQESDVILLLVDDLEEGRSIVGRQAGLLEGVVVVCGDNGLVKVELEILED